MKTLVLDTNIFVRYLIQDLPHQYKLAKQAFQDIEARKVKGFVSILVINEIIWTLENYYQLPRSIFIPQLMQIFVLSNMHITEVTKSTIMNILTAMQTTSFDFTDLYLFHTSTKENIFSFDNDFKKMR